MKLLFYALLLAALASCRTIDVEQRVRDAGAGTVDSAEATAAVVVTVEGDREPSPPSIIEKPVYVPDKPAPPSQPAAKGRQAVEESNRKGILKPSDYSHAAVIYDYGSDWVYEVYTQPLRASDIRLEPGEQAVEAPFISDSERWMLGAGVNYEDGVPVQHIYIKPTETSLEASLIINTDRRVYHVILRSYKDVYMPIIRWRYQSSGMPKNFFGPLGSEARGTSGGNAGGTAGGETDTRGAGGEPAKIDPRFISFNYRITYSLFGKPDWLPDLVYDDGKKTYVVFPEEVLQGELPAVFENRGDVVNYRVVGNLLIIDKLVESLTVKMAEKEISVEKKRK
ncbi:MAG: TrbG/VirB9 family P-type conjugative transfer protein [Treponema sp.]|jgi:type IV secretion system protein VirB9|nr:TrbG/VirB9 family P-type conjugative transfer protein [Treponema sp.]